MLPREERDVLVEEMRKIDECDMGEFSVHSEVARKRSLSWEIDGGHRRPQRKEIICTLFFVVYGTSVVSAQMLELSLLGVGTVLLLERDSW